MADSSNVISISLKLLTEDFQNQIKGFTSKFTEQMKGAFTGSSSLMTSGYLEGFRLIEEGGRKCWDGVAEATKSAMDYTTSVISSAAGFQTLLKISNAEALKLTRSFNEIDEINNRKYDKSGVRIALRQSIGDDVVQRYYNPLDIQKGLATSADVLGRLGQLLGSVPNTSLMQQQKFGGALLSNPTLRSLERDEVYRNSPVIQRGLVNAESLTGIKFDHATRMQRVDLVKALVDTALTPEMIQQTKNSLSNSIDTWKAQLFSPATGLFSFSRMLQPGNVDSSVIASMTTLASTLGNIKGDGGFFKSFADDVLGFGVSEMSSLNNAIKSGFGSGSLKAAGAIAQGVFDGIKDSVIGVQTAVGLVLSPLDAALNSFGILSPSIKEVAEGFTILITAASAKIAFGWIVELTSSMLGLASFGWVAMAEGITLVVHGLEYMRIGAVATAEAFSALDIAVLADPIVLAGAAIVAAGIAIYHYWNPIKGLFSSVFSALGAGISEAVPLINSLKASMAGLAGMASGVGHAFQSMVGGIEGAASALTHFNGLKQSTAVGGLNQGSYNGVKQGVSFATKAIGYSIPLLAPLLGGGSVKNHADGNEIGEALVREAMAMPPGATAKIAVVNDSEAILNRSQQAEIKKSVGGHTFNFSPNIHIEISGDEDKILSTLKQNIESVLNECYNSAKISML